MSFAKEISITVPAELVRTTTGLSMDFGGSVCKVIYRSKENLKEIESNGVQHGHLQMISFPRRQWEEGLKYLKEKAEITRNGADPPTIFTTGLGCTNHGKLITDILSVQLKQITELDCFVNSFHYLASRLPRSEFLEPFETEAVDEVLNEVAGYLKMLETMENTSDTEFNGSKQFDARGLSGHIRGEPTTVPLAVSEDIYPCILAMCGSAFGFMQINKDKTYKLIDGTNRGGKSFYAIGKLLTDCENFEEFVELASKGNHRNLDVYSGELFRSAEAADGDSSMYAQIDDLASSILIYSFGKCDGPQKRDAFRREDIARAWLQYYVLDVVVNVHLLCLATGINRVFFSGSLTNTGLIRRIFAAELTRRNIGAAMLSLGKVQPTYDFIKPGSHLGAIGAMMSQLGEYDTTF